MDGPGWENAASVTSPAAKFLENLLDNESIRRDPWDHVGND